MAMLKVGSGNQSRVIDTKQIALVADTYLLMNQRRANDPSFVLTGKDARAQVDDIVRADSQAGFVATESGRSGMYLNIDHMKEIRDHAVLMDFGMTNSSPVVSTTLSKAEMQQRVNNVSALLLESGYAKNTNAKTPLGRAVPRGFQDLYEQSQSKTDSSLELE